MIQYLRLLTFGVKVEFGEPRYRHSGFTLESDGQAKKIDSLKGLLMKIMIRMGSENAAKVKAKLREFRNSFAPKATKG